MKLDSLLQRLLALCAILGALLCGTDVLHAQTTGSSYLVSTSASPLAGGATKGGGMFSQDAQVSVTASPAAGYHFLNWTENAVPVGPNAILSFTAAANRTLIANFAPDSYTVSAYASASEGTVRGGGTFSYGDRVTVVATPAANYRFDRWTESGGTTVSYGSTFVFPATASRTLVALFTPVIYKLPAGVTYNAASNTYSSDSNAYAGIVTNGTGTLTIGTAQPITYWVNTSVMPSLGGSVTGGGSIIAGGSVTVLATPAAGFTFANWTENGAVVSVSASFTFTPGANRTLVAHFTGGYNANLASLLSEEARLTPAFETSITSYSAKVPSGTSTFTLTPILEQDGASIRINAISATPGALIQRISATPGALVQPIALSVGDNTISTTVTTPDGVTTRTYTITVNRGSFPNDLNGDGTPDLIFQNNAGQIVAWFADVHGTPIFASFLYNGGLGDWKLVGASDMNGDGFLDMVFQNGVGQICVWFLDGTGDQVDFATGSGIKGTGYLYGGSLAGWRLSGIVDVNGDGFADLIFQNTTTGQVYAWFLDGTGASINFGTGSGIKGTGYLYGGSLAGWRLAAVNDVNSDSIPDLVFQNTGTGQLQAWLLDGTGASINFDTRSGIKSTGYLYGGSLAGWQLAAIADANGDGIADLLFQNTGTGQVIAWFLDGTGASINFGTGSGIKTTGWLYNGSLSDWRLH